VVYLTVYKKRWEYVSTIVYVSMQNYCVDGWEARSVYQNKTEWKYAWVDRVFSQKGEC